MLALRKEKRNMIKRRRKVLRKINKSFSRGHSFFLSSVVKTIILNSLACILMYLRNASFDHLP